MRSRRRRSLFQQLWGAGSPTLSPLPLVIAAWAFSLPQGTNPRRNRMNNHLRFYIDGAWVDPARPATLDVIDPSTEEAYTTISIGSAADVDRAVAAAKAAFPAFSQTSKDERLALLR